jgi:xylan 1,4-beta-xylosidase
VTKIFEGSELGLTEGPHLYHIGEYYYLLTAEGGTGYDHAVTLARSKSLTGPFEIHPEQHIATARYRPDHELQRVGHGDIVEAADGSFYMTHLCSRPLASMRRSPLGRETALRRLILDTDGWFRLHPFEREAPPAPAPSRYERRYSFENGKLPLDFQWLRSPESQSLFTLGASPGRLRLFGRESVGSPFHQSLVARRQAHFCFEAETEIHFEPEDFQQAAGLICYYNAHKFHYLYVSRDERIGKHIGIMSCEADQSLVNSFPIADALIAAPSGVPLKLRVRVREHELQFSWAPGGGPWRTIPVTLDHSLLSDEAGKGDGANFTGTFVGMCCQDLTGRRLPADFSYFAYRERKASEALDDASDALDGVAA